MKLLINDYEVQEVFKYKGMVCVCVARDLYIPLNRRTVAAYELVNSDTQKSAVNVAGRAIVGGALLGGAGMIAGGMTAKDRTSYTLAIKLKDGSVFFAKAKKDVYSSLIYSLYGVTDDGETTDLHEMLINTTGASIGALIIIIIAVALLYSSCSRNINTSNQANTEYTVTAQE